MEFNDRVAALLSCAVYYEKVDKETMEKNIPRGWQRKEMTEHPESGFFCVLFTKVRLENEGQAGEGSHVTNRYNGKDTLKMFQSFPRSLNTTANHGALCRPGVKRLPRIARFANELARNINR